MRVYELARELQLGNSELLSTIRAMGIEVSNHMTSLEKSDEEKIRARFRATETPSTPHKRPSQPRMVSPEKTAALLIDGTALYLRSKDIGIERLNYEALDRFLKQQLEVRSFSPALFFTAFDPANEGQEKFLSFLKTRLGWFVEAIPIWKADASLRDSNRSDRSGRDIRFDAYLSFALGRLVDRRDKIVLLSDSYGLAGVASEAATYKTKIFLSFFGSQLDSRWHAHLFDQQSVSWIDLDGERELSSASRRDSISSALGVLKEELH